MGPKESADLPIPQHSMKVGLFGGTFNPIHNCHLTVAAQTRDRLKLDSVIFIPSGDPPHKPSSSLAPARHRFEMVRLAVAIDPSFSVSEVEIERPTKSYSIETVHVLRQKLGFETELFFMVGLDAFLDFPTWKQAPDLLRACHFVVLSRPGMSFRTLLNLPLLPPMDPVKLEALDSEQEGRMDIPIPGGTTLILLGLPPCNISASDIRQRLKRRLSVSKLLPAPVESYIMRMNLYQEETDHTGV